MGLEIQINESEKPTLVSLRGNLVAGVGDLLQAALGDLESDQVMFDLKDVTIINSSGIGEWSDFLREQMEEKRFWFRCCTPNIVDTINLLPSFLSHGKVESMFVDYQCGGCSFEQRVELNMLRDVTPAGQIRRQLTCEKCKQAMNTIFPEEDLFAFLNQP